MEKPRIRTASLNPLKRYIADPAAVGLYAFAGISFAAGAINCEWVTAVDAGIWAPAIFYGGMIQLIAGLIDFIRGEKVSGTTFTSFGAFWISNGLLMLPGKSAETMASYDSRAEYDAAVGWFILPFGVLAAACGCAMLNTSYVQITLLLLVTIDYTGLAIGKLAGSPMTLKVIGYFIIVTAILASYLATAQLLFPEVRLPLGRIPKNDDEDAALADFQPNKSITNQA